MQIKLIALSSNELIAYSSTTKMISNSIAQMTNTVPADFTFFSNHKEMFSKLNDYFKTSEIIILAVDLQMYISTKGVLFKALGIKCGKNQDILNIINSDACISTLNETQANAHAAIPLGGEAFITNDGLFSGFGIQSNNQKLVMLPIDDKRILSLLPKQIRPFITEGLEINYDEAPSDADIEEQMKETLHPSPIFAPNNSIPANKTVPANNVALAPEKISEDEDVDMVEEQGPAEISEETTEENSNPISLAINKMLQKNFQVSFAKQNNNLLVEAILETNSDLHKGSVVRIVKVSDEKIDDTEESYKIATASSAKSAMKSGHTQFGAAVSPVYKDETGSHYIFSALADEEKASVFKIYAIDGEKEEALVTTGITTVFEALSEKADEMEVHLEPAPKQHRNKTGEKQPLSFSVKIGIWLIVVITLCTVITLIINFILNNRSDNSGGQLVSLFQTLTAQFPFLN